MRHPLILPTRSTPTAQQAWTRQTTILPRVRRPLTRLRDLALETEAALALGDLVAASTASARAHQLVAAYLSRRDAGCRS